MSLRGAVGLLAAAGLLLVAWRAAFAVWGLPPLPLPQAPAAEREAAMTTWLDGFYRSQEQADGATPHPIVCEDGARLRPPRDNLVVVAAGDSFNASAWLDQPQEATWDLVVIYYGAAPASIRCPQCTAVYFAAGPKWRLLHRLTLLPAWRQRYARRYRAVMFPDDDLQMDTHTINTVFRLMARHGVLLAQPSICHGEPEVTYTVQEPLYQNTSDALHFTTMVEIMAPTFEMGAFEGLVKHTLHDAHYGWGLDFLWPFLMRYPRDKVAVVDEVCVSHPKSEPDKPNSLYKVAAPHDKVEEERRRYAMHGYTEEAARLHDVPYRVGATLGHVPRSAAQPCERPGQAAGELALPTLPPAMCWLAAAACTGCILLLLRVHHLRAAMPAPSPPKRQGLPL